MYAKRYEPMHADPHIHMYTQPRTRPHTAKALTAGAHCRYNNESYHLVLQFDLLQLETSGSVYPEDPPSRTHKKCLFVLVIVRVVVVVGIVVPLVVVGI